MIADAAGAGGPATPPWTEAAVRSALALGAGDGMDFSELSTDTRSLAPGALFVALRGERFDGHDHLAAARDRGARAAVVRRGTAPIAGLPLLEVEDTLRAWGDLAHARRGEVPGPVIAVTGTNGKTSTKEMIAAALGTRYRVHATRANLNNLVGVPLTILEAPIGTDALVVEAGANLPGEIARYREIIDPDVAVITNVGAGHLEGFGSVAGVLREKIALARGVPLAVTGPEPPELPEAARATAERVITAGLSGADRVPDRVSLDAAGRATLTLGGRSVRLPLPGRHLAANAMLAWAVAEELGLDLGPVAGALERLTLPGGRSEVFTRGRLTILNDCYNANPQSFASVLETAAAMRAGRRLALVVGTMRELGPESDRLHQEVARALVAAGPDLLAATGDFVPALAPYRAQLGPRLVTAAEVPALGRALAARLAGDELVVLKASRGIALERILPYLTPAAGPEKEP